MNIIKLKGKIIFNLDLVPFIGLGVGVDFFNQSNRVIILLPFVSIELGYQTAKS
jgi:hypothetical protein